MIDFKNKKIYFSGRGEKCDKEELVKYFIQNEATMVEDLNESDMIIQGYMTPVHLEDKFYLLSKEGKEVIEIEKLEKEFSANLDVDSIVMAIKISKDQQRLIKLLNNRYFSDDIFTKLLKYYNWGDEGLHDNDENRDVSTAIVSRFCSLQETNHNIQHSPIGVYYTALETANPKLLETIYNMPYFKISDKNAQEDQPLTLKDVVALNPNTPKPVLMQILKDNNIEELRFLAMNQSINKLISNKLYELNDYTIIKNLIIGGNLEIDKLSEALNDQQLKIDILKNIELKDEIFENILATDLSDIEIVYLSSNGSLTITQIDKLFEYDIENANINLLKNLNCKVEKLEEFFSKNDLIYNIAIAHNENLNDQLFSKLYSLDDININMTLALNPKTSNEILKDIYSKNIHELNLGLSENVSTPINILMQLQIDNRYTTIVSNNETYKEFSRNSLGIIQEENNRFKRNTYDMDAFFND